MNLPVVIDPFSQFGSEVAGDTAEQRALNLWEAIKIDRQFSRQLTLHSEPQDLRKLFRGQTLSDAARDALRQSDAAIRAAFRKQSQT
jgi:hypothetical protein